MSSPQISLAMLARSAYRPAIQQAQAGTAQFQPEPQRQTVKASPAVSVDLSDAARAALLGLQEIPLGAPPELSHSGTATKHTTRQYLVPGSQVNLSI